MSFDISTLVTDRTASDVVRISELNKLGFGQLNSLEKAEWYGSEIGYLLDATNSQLVDSNGYVLMVVTKQGTGHKGAYNYADFNRVGEAIKFIANLYNQYGYDVVVSPKTDFKIGEIPSVEQLQHYIDDIHRISTIVTLFESTPSIPTSIDNLTWKSANAIEQMLIDVNSILESMITTFVPCGEAICGGDNL